MGWREVLSKKERKGNGLSDSNVIARYFIARAKIIAPYFIAREKQAQRE